MTIPQPPVRILVVDDHYVTRFGIRQLLAKHADMEVVGEAGDGASALSLYKTLKPDLVLMDIRMDGIDGVTATRMLTAADPDVRILILSSFDGESVVKQACQAGAAGFVLKESGGEEILTAIRSVANGQAHMPLRLWKHLNAGTEQTDLSSREVQVLKMIAAGHKTRDIASSLDLSQSTVKMYVSRIFTKLGVESRAQAIREAERRGLI